MARPTVPGENDSGERELYRREAMGAFAHEIRTPLTSIRMVMELGRRQSSDGELVLDRELASMLNTSVGDLQSLADDLQEASRLERGRLALSSGPCDLGAAVQAARELAAPIEVQGEPPELIEGPWDAARLVRAVAGFIDSTNRMGDGSGGVSFEWQARAQDVTLAFASGRPGGATKPVAADAGFAFFRSRQAVLAMGGTVHCKRSERCARITVVLPRTREISG